VKTHADSTLPPTATELNFQLSAFAWSLRCHPYLAAKTAMTLTISSQSAQTHRHDNPLALGHRDLHLVSHHGTSVRLVPSANAGVCAMMGLIPSRGPAQDHTVDRRCPSKARNLQSTRPSVSHFVIPFRPTFTEGSNHLFASSPP
jgi:hypothetical protein